MKKKKIRIKWKNVFLFLFLIICLIIFILCSIKIVKWYFDGRKTNKIINTVSDEVNINEISEGENINPPENKEDPYWDYIKMNLIDVNFNDLKKKNKEVKGWIQVNGTNINYPFVQTNDNEYYLTHSFNKTYNDAGWIFMDYRNNYIDFDKNTILYGHGRLDGTMFSSLKNILKSSWYGNKDNYVIKLSTEKENTLWQVFSVYKLPTTSDYIQTTFYSDNEYEKFLETMISRSAFNFNTNVNTNDKILTLSTCYNDKEKVVMQAKLIKLSKR